MHEFLHNPIVHGIYHSLLILPLLYLAYVLMEFIEHKASNKFREALAEDRRTGPVAGSVLGILPLCGFTDLGAGLYAGRVISIGTLIALFLSASGETLLLTASYPGKVLSIIFLLLIKLSIAGICGGKSGCAYTMAKHAVMGLTKNTAFVYRNDNIRCNAICPGGINTEMVGPEIYATADQKGLGVAMLAAGFGNRMAEPLEIANAALFLASDEASIINGAVMTADSGLTAF
jgi:NAD(P)-dependent dehydrogenase (short-subunit alcohol dehydrogenase family)